MEPISVVLTLDEMTVLNEYRMARQNGHADLVISVKGHALHKIYATQKKLFDRKGGLRETEDSNHER